MISPSWFNLLAVENRLFELPKIGEVPLSTILPLVLAIAGFGLGIWFASAIRMRDYGWKVGLIFAAWLVALSAVLFGNYKLGVDLQGGVILVYQVDAKETAALDPLGRSDQWDMEGLIKVLGRRLNPEGYREIVIRPFSGDQVEIVVPEADEAEVDLIKQRITTGGSLRFLIVANDPLRDERVIELATQQSNDDERKLDRNVMDGDKVVGYWARVGREDNQKQDSPYRVEVQFYTLRDSRTGKILELTPQERSASKGQFSELLASRGIRQVDVLMVVDPENDVRGSDLASTSKGLDESLNPEIEFTMRGDGVSKMGMLTSENIERPLGIVFDNELLSAPSIRSRISERGRITGRFTEEEVKFMVEILRSGSMPVVLYPNPISENRIGSLLGHDTIEKGTYSIAIALLVVLGFTWFYYRFAGFVACLALILNLLLTVAIMVMLQAPFTLPGLAGLVLTVGMSLDANVLIFERIREEKEKGAALRSAIRNGFDRAMVTVIDSNVTTLLTAIVLYAIGTDQVRGFGITLILGILTSMFTAIFMARVIFEICERKRWISDLSMIKMFGTLSIDWVKLFGPATIGSVLLIALGLVATVARGKSLFDIDLAGGTSVTFVLEQPLREAELRKKLSEAFSGMIDEETKSRVDFSVNEVTMEGEQAETVWKVDSSLDSVQRLQQVLAETFTENGQIGLKTYELQVADLRQSKHPYVTGADSARSPEAPSLDAVGPSSTNQPAGGSSGTIESDDPPATNGDRDTKADQDARPADEAKPAKDDEPSENGKSAEPPAAEQPEEKPSSDSPPPAVDEPAPAENESPTDEKNVGLRRQRAVYLTSYLAQNESDGPPPTEDAPAERQKSADESDPPSETSSETSPPDEKSAPATDASPATPAEAPAADSSPSDSAPRETTSPDAAPNGTTGGSAAQPPASAPQVWTVARLDFKSTRITGQAVEDRVAEVAKNVVGQNPDIVVDNPEWNGRDNAAFTKWTVSIQLPEDQASQVFTALQKQLDSSPIWQSWGKIGGQVSSDTRYKAVTAILFSLVGILAYVWFRFQRFSWGVAAIAALVHDSLIMLGGIAASYWLVGPLGFAGVEEFKISLPVIAAFLTLIGYSINDTIVIFDRIREIRGKSQNLTPEMINAAVNQTMSRTILTGGLTLVVILILYFFGGPGIHAFAFSLVIGSIAGVYSTVFIASPLLLWMLGGKSPSTTKPAANREMARST